MTDKELEAHSCTLRAASNNPSYRVEPSVLVRWFLRREKT
jgi:hypothetical protein